MTRLTALVVAVALFTSLTGCVTITMDAAGLGKPVSMSSDLGPGVEYVETDKFRERDRAFWLIGLFNIKDPDVRGMLVDADPEADAYTDVQIRTVFRPLDIVIAAVTFGILVPRTVVIRGNAVEYVQ